MAYLVGCCGWGEAKDKYFSHFPVVEVQHTFYEPPAVELASKWRALAPESFQFCVKAWQLITHTARSPTYRKLKSRLSPAEHELVGSFRPTEQVWLAWERTAAIARVLRARVVLFQCPSSFLPNTENIQNLRTFFSQVKREEFLFAWEPRGNWPPEIVRQLCSDLDLLHCVDPFKAESTYGRSSYWRLHGKTGYSYRYSDEELRQLSRMLLGSAQGGSHCYVFFNNIWMKDDALRLQQLIWPTAGV